MASRMIAKIMKALSLPSPRSVRWCAVARRSRIGSKCTGFISPGPFVPQRARGWDATADLSTCLKLASARTGVEILAWNMFHAKISTPVRADASFKQVDKSAVASQPRARCGTNGPGEMNPVHFDPIRERRATAHHRTERGEGKLKAFIILAIILLAIYSAVKIVPIYVSNYQLSDKMQEQARFSVVNHYTEDQIRNNIFKVVEELEIPVK